MSDTSNNQDTIRFVDSYQTALKAGTYEVTAKLNVPDVFKDAVKDERGEIISPSTTVKLHVAGPRFFLPPSEIHSVFPPENGAGDYNNILPHVVLNRHTLPWERLVDGKSEDIPFLALLIFSDDEEANGDVTPPTTISLADLLIQLNFKYVLEPGEKLTDKVSVIDVKPELLRQIMPTGEALKLLAHGREIESANPPPMSPNEDENQNKKHQRAVIIANRLPAPPLLGIIPREKLESETSNGVRVEDVQKDSAAEQAGILAGDIITKVGTTSISDLYSMTKAMALVLKPQAINQLDEEISFILQRAKNNTEKETVEVKVKVSDRDKKRRNIAHLIMLENCCNDSMPKEFRFTENASEPIRLVCLKSWQFNCTTDEPTLSGRLLNQAFTFELLCVPKTNGNDFESIRLMSYAALPYSLRWGDRAHTLYHGPLVASVAHHDYPNENAFQEVSNAVNTLKKAQQNLKTESDNENLRQEVKKAEAILRNVIDRQIPASADGLVRLLQNERIFDVSLAAAWQLGQMLMLRDQSVAMEYFAWRRRSAQIRAREGNWNLDGHLHTADDFHTGLTPIPKNVEEWCHERLKLRGLPFEYLIPDARMLPENSLRIFRIHETWMECLLSGALAVGRGGEADRILEAEYRSTLYPATARDRTGFLLRSPAVDEHPDLKVVAEGSESQIRLERIGPGVLLGLYAGKFTALQFSLPPIGLHFGLKEGNEGFVKKVKDTTNGNPIDGEVIVALQGDRVVKISDLGEEISKKLKPSDVLSPGVFAFQMCEGTEVVKFEVLK